MTGSFRVSDDSSYAATAVHRRVCLCVPMWHDFVGSGRRSGVRNGIMNFNVEFIDGAVQIGVCCYYTAGSRLFCNHCLDSSLLMLPLNSLLLLEGVQAGILGLPFGWFTDNVVAI